MTERRHLHLDGLRLSYLEAGSPAPGRPSLVLLHGLMGCAETFAPLIDELGPHLHIIALDLPGAGQSDRREDVDAGLAATAEYVQRALRALGLRQPIVLGHSHGGAVALSLAAHHAEFIRSLVLLAPAHPYFDEGDPLIRFYLSLPGRLFAYSMPWYPQWVQLLCLRRMAGPRSWDSPERLKPYRDNLRTPGTISHLLRLLRCWHSDMGRLRRAMRKRLRTPSLIVWGDCDRAVSVHTAAQLRSRLRRSELVILPGIGHRPAEETPAAIASLVQQWLAVDLAGDAVSHRPAISAAPSSSLSQARMASLMTSSFDAGD